MQNDSALTTLAHTIQLAVAPVFLLSGVGAILNVLAHRLARIIDRTRALEASPTDAPARFPGELDALHERARLINRAIGLCTASAVLVSGVVALLFLGAFLRLDLALVVAAAFFAAMLALIGGLVSFLHEVRLATRHLREVRLSRMTK
jgi:hypothetical protein